MAPPRALQSMGVTAREADVLAAVGERLTNAEVASRLFVSKRTVESHVSALLRKLGASTRQDLVVIAADVFRAPDAPSLRFVDVAGTEVAWTSFGAGPVLLFVPEWTSNVETAWLAPNFARFANSLGAAARVVVFDKRGFGVSDGLMGTVDDACVDAVAVLDAAEADRAVVVAGGLGGLLGIRLAAQHPERVAGLVLVGPSARLRRDDDYGIGLTDELLRSNFERRLVLWRAGVEGASPVPGDPPDAEIAARYWRSAFRLPDARRLGVYLATLDLRDDLATVQCPTLVLHRRDDAFIPLSHGRYVAANVRSARLQELPGADQTMWAGDAATVVAAIAGFLAEVADEV